MAQNGRSEPNCGQSRVCRIQQVVEDCRRRRESGEPLSDESLIEENPDLMPELAAELGTLSLGEAARRHAQPAQAGGHETIKEQQQAASSGELQIRCPHCHNPIEIGADTPFSDIVCSSCGSHFSLVDDKGTYTAPTVQTIGHFETIEHLGVGAFGSVWKARDTELDRTVALKIPRKGQLTAAETEQFLREARAAAQLRHPNIVTVHEVGRDGETVYIVSDLVRGVSLLDRLTGQRLTSREAAELCVKIAEGLHHAHEAGVIHRDLKPSNIMIDADGQPHIMDFGLAKREVGEITMTLDGQALGTPAYMSPEQAKGEAHRSDRRSDIYSLGVILFELLTGELPFRGNRQMLLHQAINDEPPGPRKLNSNIPRDLETISLKCLEKEPQKRYSTAKELAEELRRFLNGEPIHARPIGPLARMWRRCKRHPAVSSLAAALLLALVVGLAGVTSQWIRADQQRDIAKQQRDIANQQRDDANRSLYHSLVREARAIRLARVSGYRQQAWDRLQQALALNTSVRSRDEIRQIAVACMGDFIGLEPTVWKDFPSPVMQITLCPQKPQLAIALEDGTVLLRDLDTGAEIARLRAGQSPVDALAFGPQGRTLVSGDRQGNIRIWGWSATDGWRRTRTFLLEEAGVTGLGVTADGRQLLIRRDSTSKLLICDLTDEAGEPTVADLPVSDEVELKRFSRDGRLLATAQQQDGTWEVSVWDVAKRRMLKTLTPDVGEIVNVTFGLDGRAMVCWGKKDVRMFDAAEYRGTTYERSDGSGQLYAVSPHSRFVAKVSRTLGHVALWNIMSNRPFGKLPHPDPQWPMHVAFSQDGRLLVTARSQSIRLWNLRTREKTVCWGHTGAIRHLGFSPDGRLLASASTDYTVKIWNSETGAAVHTLPEFRGIVGTVAFSPDGRILATGDSSGAVRIWDAHSGKELPVVVDHQLGPMIHSVAFCPNGKYFAAAGEAGATIWRTKVDAGKENSRSVLSLEEFAQPVRGQSTGRMCFSPDGRLLACTIGGREGAAVYLWDVESSREVPSSASLPATVCGFYPDSRLLMIVSDGIAEAWNVTTGQRAFRLGSPEKPVPPGLYIRGATRLSDDGRWFASATRQPVVTLWNTHSKKPVLRLPTGDLPASGLACSPDGNQLAVGAVAEGPFIWRIPDIRTQLAELGLDW